MTGADVDNPASDLRVFAYALSERAETYVAVLDVLLAAKDRFRLQLRPAEVARDLPASDVEDIAAALERLEAWGNLTRFYDTSAPETLDQFYAKRFLYQLTPAGIAAHDGVRAVRSSGIAGGGRLSAILLPAIVERLRAISVEGAEVAPDPERLYRTLLDLFGAFTELADNAGRYMNDLAVETSVIAADDDRFLAYKKAVFAYLDEFVARLTDIVPVISSLIAELDGDMPHLLALAAAADQAPVMEGEDRGPLDSFEARWTGIRSWFLREGDTATIADSLRDAMLSAISRILAALDRLNERHLRRVTREADFMQLARWLAVAPPDEAAELWDVAFGLYPARHFGDVAGDEEVDRGRSFWDATPAEVAPRLRATGMRSAPGRPGREADYSGAKQERLARLRAERRQAEQAMIRLATRTPARLSDLGALDPGEFLEFLGVIDAALAALPSPDGARVAATPMVTVRLRPVGEGATATIRTTTGTLSCPDHVLEINLADADADADTQTRARRATA